MKTTMDASEETSSISIAISEILPRDFCGADDLAYAMANFLHSFGRVSDRVEELLPEDENAFLLEVEKVVACLTTSDATLRKLVNSAKARQ